MIFLEKLRNQPEGKRKRFAVIWASILTLIIFLVWFSIFQLSFGVGKKVKSANSPFEALNSVFGSFGDDIYTAVGNIKDKVSGATNEIIQSDNSGSVPADNSGGGVTDADTTLQDLPFR